MTSPGNAVADLPRADWLIEYPPPRFLPLDQEALRIYEHAYALGLEVEAGDVPPITFTTVLIALLVGDDETSRWFLDVAASNGPEADAVFMEKGLTAERARAITLPPGKPPTVRVSSDRHLLTASARGVIGNAERWAHQVGASDIGVRHLVASYVLNPPPAHGSQMRRWNFQEMRWRSAFFAWSAERYTAEQWADASQRPAPSNAIPEFAQQQQPMIKGEALAFPGDESALAVLEQAAALHARTEDRFLRLQTVFCAVAESVRHNNDLRASLRPLWQAIEAAQSQYDRACDALFTHAPPEHPPSFSSLDISSRALNVLETARDLALATRRDLDGDLSIGILHLAGSLVSRRVDSDHEIASLGLDPHSLRAALIDHARLLGESEDAWRESLGEEETVIAGRPVDLNSDEPEAVIRMDSEWKHDPLMIRRDVETFAALLASDSLEPPLSIGLFGPWGSGKTTFLKRLQQAVNRRAEEASKARARSEPSHFVSNIVHVDFNAWHFAENALTSSLVDTILRRLSEHIRDDQVIAGRAWRDQKVRALESTKRQIEAAEAVRIAAENTVVRAERALVEKRKDAADRAISFNALARGAWHATRDALKSDSVVKESGVLDAIGDAVASTSELRSRVDALRARPAALLGDLGWTRSLIFAALVLAVPPLAAWVVDALLSMDQSVQLMSSVTAMLSVIAVWARAATGAVGKVDSALAKVVDQYTKRLDEDDGVVEAAKQLQAAQASAATAAAGVEAARTELARAQTDVANASLPAQVLQLVTDRLDSQTYDRELTTLSLARADLQALSGLLRQQREDAAVGSHAGDAAMSPRVVDRVILYIDDLDRCKPADVVRVLQLVHMLLAFELFVVVVAVDARWVKEALHHSYEWLRDEDSHDVPAGDDAPTARVTPQDYLEKIFQIAFWLEPMTSSRAASYIGSLVAEPRREAGAVFVPGYEPDQANGGTTLGKVGIAGIELDYMRALAAYVGPSPRRVKRLVNAYRLIKARLSDAQLRVFLTRSGEVEGEYRSGPYQIVIALLVIGTGAPDSSARIMNELAECDPGDSLDTVVERFRERDQRDWTTAARVLETLAQTYKAPDVSELRGWARVVRRFLLNNPIADGRTAGVHAP